MGEITIQDDTKEEKSPFVSPETKQPIASNVTRTVVKTTDNKENKGYWQNLVGTGPIQEGNDQDQSR